MSNFSLILKNCNLVNENSIVQVDIGIKGDRIEKIASQISSESNKTIDLEGKYVAPGIIDDQVHFREPGLTHKATIETESKAAIAGGVTSFLEMPNTIPQTTTMMDWEHKNVIASKTSSLVAPSCTIGRIFFGEGPNIL